MDVGEQLSAVADPTRRRILELVREEPSTVRELTDRLPVSQPAVSQHLKVLRRASLVNGTARGSSTVYTLDASGLAVVREWLSAMWDDVLDAFVETTREGSHE